MSDGRHLALRGAAPRWAPLKTRGRRTRMPHILDQSGTSTLGFWTLRSSYRGWEQPLAHRNKRRPVTAPGFVVRFGLWCMQL